MKSIVIYGAGHFAKIIRLYLDRVEGQKVVAFCADEYFLKGSVLFDGLPLIAFEKIEREYPPSVFYMFTAIGYSNMRARAEMYKKSKSKGYSLISYVDSSAEIDETVSMGENNVVLMNSVIEPFACLGNNNILWSSVTISHDVKIADNCFFASQSLLGGHCIVEDNCFIGFNATCVQNVVLMKESVVGAKSLVLSDTIEYSKNIGVPSRVTSCHQEEGAVVK